ncbi:methyl-accepting chemotaxis protein [Vogesella alkaliphila]|uniref:Methyl-accepting chemotaxis protein n=1 Tax=Vogesella alkaliphila TaxID=1193621 RepID=A0ABQ2YU46_9NEIS|nr:methyl-accepting chemotaxis protein [Vogesella alkaliphila]GGX93428.1 methyl-accepting chemotaxis protein [Vogesella alkaliphila]
MGKLKLAQRLALGFGAVITLLVLGSAFTLFRLGGIQERVSELVEYRIPVIQNSRSLSAALLSVTNAARTILLESDDKLVEEKLDILKKSAAKAQLEFKEMQTLAKDPKEVELVGKIDKSMKEFNALVDKLLPMIVRQKWDASIIVSEKLEPQERLLSMQLDKLIAYHTQVMEEQKASTTSTLKETMLAAIIAIIASVGASIMVALLIARSLTRQIGGEPDYAAEVMKEIAHGNLGISVKIGKGDNSSLLYNLSRMTSELNDALRTVERSVQESSAASDELRNTMQRLVSRSEEQNRAADEMASVIQQMAVGVQELHHSAGSAESAARTASGDARQGVEVIQGAVREMDAISTLIKTTAGSIHELGRQSQTIDNIVSVIRDVADQTNLLALNAAIEAARAGEQGRGFAVVADEVRKLAERTTKATGEIAEMIGAIRISSQQAVEAMNQSVERAHTSAAQGQRAGESIVAIQSGTETVGQSVLSIASSLSDQARSGEQVSREVQRITAIAQRNREAADEAVSAAARMSELTEEIRQSFSRFHTA